eukprot:223010_1
MESKSITLDANGIKSLNKDEMNGPAFGYGSGFDIGMESKSITLDANGIKSLNKDEMNGPAFGYGSGFDIGMESKSITLDANGIKSLNKDEMNGPAFGNGSGFDIGAAFGTNGMNLCLYYIKYDISTNTFSNINLFILYTFIFLLTIYII